MQLLVLVPQAMKGFDGHWRLVGHEVSRVLTHFGLMEERFLYLLRLEESSIFFQLEGESVW
jgi:hypothetical protein